MSARPRLSDAAVIEQAELVLDEWADAFAENGFEAEAAEALRARIILSSYRTDVLSAAKEAGE